MEAPEDDKDEEKNVAVTALQDITKNLSVILHQAKEDVNENIEDFVAHKISKLFRLVGIYSKAFKDLKVGTKREFERKIGSFFRHGLIQELFDELLQNEADVKAGKGRILLVSFGEANGASRWIEDTGCSYDLVLDPDRKIYTAFGLFRSVSKVWSISCLMYYVEQVVNGRQLPKPYENVHDDPIQMGGDFILDGRGFIKMFYPSKVSMDRPSVDQILSVLKSQG